MPVDDVDALLMFGEHQVDTEQLEREAAWAVLDRLERGGNLSLPLVRELYKDARCKGRKEMAATFARWGIMYKALTRCKH